MAGEERYVSLAEVKSILEKEEGARIELTNEQRMALEHAEKFTSIDETQSEKLAEELQMNLERVSESSAIKIADILPTDPDEVRAIFAKERFNLEDGEVKDIIAMVAKYR